MARQQKTPTLYSPEYACTLRLLRQARKDAGVTQAQVANKLQYQPSAISKFERGELRLDIIQLRLYCHAIGMPLSEFVQQLETALALIGSEPSGSISNGA